MKKTWFLDAKIQMLIFVLYTFGGEDTIWTKVGIKDLK